MLASRMLPNGQWPELFPAVFEIIRSSDAIHKESGCAIIHVIAEFSFESLGPHLATIRVGVIILKTIL